MNSSIPENESARTDTETTATVTPSSVMAPATTADSVGRVASAATPADGELQKYQRAYLLQQVSEAPERQLAKGKANRFPRAVARELSLTPTLANDLRDEMVNEGYLNTLKKAGSIVYELTDQGKQLLASLPQKPVPEGRKPTREGPITQEVQLARKTFLLFQLFEAPNHTMDQKQANRFREPGRKFLDLRATTANRLRKEMADQGLIAMTKESRNATYRLTQRGIEFLGASGSFPETEFAIHGHVLNLLLEAAREAAKQFSPTESPRPVHEPASVN